MHSSITLFLLRHGIAEPERFDLADEARQLTEQGHRVLRECSAFYRALFQGPSEICSSPYLRARQTAEIVANLFPGEASYRVIDSLALGGDVDELLVDLRQLASEIDLPRLVLVGHQPDLLKLSFELCGEGLRRSLDIERGCVLELTAPLSLHRKSATLVAYHSLRALGKIV